ncbi:hypothetical protein [Aquimarina agarivorans]|uniref:hypothetical protein n=1 Tax=Aquimarina agarivorans TaxID=980584 RepID=UPI000248FB28|nr:hypothetical protein [Aquimarina agarivorans]
MNKEKLENNKLTEIKKDKNLILNVENKPMYIGVTFLYKNNNDNLIEVVLISCIIEIPSIKDLTNIDKKAKEISSKFNYEYLGINDLFHVTGKLTEGEIIGRTSYYELNTFDKSRSLIMDDSFFKNKSSIINKFYCFTTIYFCKNDINQNFTISIKSIFKNNSNNLHQQIHEISKNRTFLKKIISNSIDKIQSIEFVGIEDLYLIDLNMDIFETLFSNINEIQSIEDEIISEKKVKELITDILN